MIQEPDAIQPLSIQPSLDPTVVAAGIAHLRATDEAMAQLINRIGPCELTLEPNLFASLVRAIMAQQISTKAMQAIMGRVRALYAPAPLSAAAILATPDETLRQVGCSRAKVLYLKDLSARIEAGTLDLERLPALPDEEVIAALIAVKGIGRWTAEMLLIFALGRLNVWPVDDLGIVLGVQALYDLPQKPTKKEMAAYGERWRPYRTLASWYLWRIRTPNPQG